MPFVGYIRVSSVNGRNGDSFISPDVQEETIRRLASAKGLELAGIEQELDVSGGKAVDDRKLGELVRAVERGESEGVIVWKLSRFSRSLLDAVETTARITKAGGRLVAEDFDSAQPMGKALLGLLAGLAEEELDARREGWAQARSRAIKRGVLTTKTPYGYERNGDGRLHPHPEQAEIIRRIFKLRSEGKPLAELKRVLADVPSPSGGNRWPHSTLRQILRNRVYLGEIRHGEFVNREAHEPLVDETTFQLVQAVKPRRVPPPGDLPRSARTLAAGLARCAACGHTLKPINGHSPGEIRFYCKGNHCQRCPAPALIGQEELDAFLEEWFLDALDGRHIAVEAVEAREGLQEAQQAVDAAESALQAYAATATILDPATFQSALETRNSELQEARKVLADLRAQSASLGSLPDGDLHALWPTFSPLEKRELIGALVEAVYVEKGRGPISERVRVEQI